jgi:hypothetical protein
VGIDFWAKDFAIGLLRSRILEIGFFDIVAPGHHFLASLSVYVCFGFGIFFIGFLGIGVFRSRFSGIGFFAMLFGHPFVGNRYFT